MGRMIAIAVLAVSLLGCASRTEQVPLPVDEDGRSGVCILMYAVVDLVANPDTGTPIARSGVGTALELKWPKGYTAWRAGNETEIVDANGSVVARTGGRYWLCPQEYLDGWVVGEMKPCPIGEAINTWMKCELGSGVM